MKFLRNHAGRIWLGYLVLLIAGGIAVGQTV